MLDLSKKSQQISASPTLSIDAKYKAMKAANIDVVGFGAGEPDFDTPQHIKDAAIKAIQNGMTKYTPASGTLQLREAICRKLERENHLKYAPNQIVVSNGAKHSIVNALGAICNPGDEVIIPAPFWVSYPEMVKLADGVPVSLMTTEENCFKFKASEFERAITDKTKAIIICSPSNPTGMAYSENELREIADIALKHQIYIISDEIYEHLIYDGCSNVSIASFSDAVKDITIIINGVSKSYSMTGWRIGYTASNAKIASIMGNVQSHATSNPNSIAQAAAVAALDGDQNCVEEMRKVFEQRRNYMVDRINKMECVSCVKPHGAFYVMMNVSKILNREYFGKMVTTSDELCEMLLEHAKLALVPGTGFEAPDYVRWSYATSMENITEGLNRLEKFIKG